MPKPVDTQALLWLRALRAEMNELGRNLDYCIHGQENGRLRQKEFDDFRDRMTKFARKIIVSTEGSFPGEE